MPDEEKKDYVVKDRRFSAQQDAESSNSEVSTEEKPETKKKAIDEQTESPSGLLWDKTAIFSLSRKVVLIR